MHSRIRGDISEVETFAAGSAIREVAPEKRGLLRIIDESGDDYLYPKLLFRSIALPQAIKKAVLAAA